MFLRRLVRQCNRSTTLVGWYYGNCQTGNSEFFQAPCLIDAKKFLYKGEPHMKPNHECKHIFPAIAGCGLLVGMGLYSDPALAEENPPIDAFHPEAVVKQTREAIHDRLGESKSHGHVPPLTVSCRGQQVAVRFPIPAACDIYGLLIDVISRLGSDGTEMAIRAWNSAVARQVMISENFDSLDKVPPLQRNEEDLAQPGNVCVVFFEPLLGEKAAEVEFLKRGNFNSKELDAVVSALRIAGGLESRFQQRRFSNRVKVHGPKEKRALEKLEKLGVKVYGIEPDTETDQLSWDNIAGYQEQKREIEDTVLLALQQPEVYDSIAQGTRCKFESNRPRAILFEGPPGTGKTSCARVIASQAGVPLLYVPLEVVTSKYYGESERLLSSVFNAGNELANGAIIFLDEIDSLATSRDSDMHEATRRMLSVLLRQMDGFEQDKRIVVIAATNRKQDLDPALLSRFDASITFGLPDHHTREEIAVQYARQLSESELSSLATICEGMSGRDIRDVCQQAERRWASKIIKSSKSDPPVHGLPPIAEYLESAKKRRLQNVGRLGDEQVNDFMKMATS